MKSFKSFLSEAETFDFPLAHYTPDGKHQAFSSKNLCDPNIRAQINVALLQHTDVLFANPHTALNCVAKVLAHYGVIVPKAQWPAVDGGELIWRIAQNGEASGYEPLKGSTADANEGNFIFLYFEYQVNETGRYICYAEICDADGLESLLEEETDGTGATVDANTQPSSSDSSLARLKTNIVGEDKEHPGEGTHAERSKIAKKARKGENVGHGNFNKVAAKAAKEYGSKEAGEKVAAAAMWKNKHFREEVQTTPHKIGDKLIGHIHYSPEDDIPGNPAGAYAYTHHESGHSDNALSHEDAVNQLERFHAKRSRYMGEEARSHNRKESEAFYHHHYAAADAHQKKSDELADKGHEDKAMDHFNAHAHHATASAYFLRAHVVPDDEIAKRFHERGMKERELAIAATKKAGSTNLKEHLGANATTKDYIDDFEKSKNPRFKGKSKEKRRQMAIAASMHKK